MNKYNFFDILSNGIEIEELNKIRKYTFDGIQIPMIQRDYAQGRKEESEIRKRFLNAIFEALGKGENLELDFIYGSIKEIDKKHYFIPLDGQQRITTLFLLYWYIGNRELNGEHLESLRCNLMHFTYSTRISAREFCEKLSKISIRLKINPSAELEKASWFYTNYKKDPTVMAMLLMLDAIHVHYENLNKLLYPSLSKLTFYILPLDGFNLSDELYIKMNARGKQLTDYENFKADLTKWLQDIKNPFRVDFDKPKEVGGRRMPFHLSFSLKLDNDWMNLFWNYTKTNDKTEDKIVDPYFVRFWNRYLLNSYITQSEVSQEAIEREELFQVFYGNKGNDSMFKYENFDIYNTIFEKDGVISAIEKTLDGFWKHFDDIKEDIRPVWDINDDWSLFNDKITQPQRILFYAVTQYLERNDFNIVKFKNWIRIVWNIIIDPDIRSISAMVNVMRLIKQLSIGSSDIYRFIVSDESLNLINQSNFKTQLEEERLKAKLILSDSHWEIELINGEKHPLFLGNIGFLLLSNPDLESYRSRLRFANQLFISKGSNNDYLDNHRLMRALISSFDNWNELFKLDLGDNYNNWQLLLRRNLKVKDIVCNICDSISDKNLKDKIDNVITQDSIIHGYADTPEIAARIEYIHKQLYADEKLHAWMQHQGAIKLKKKGDRIYIERPGSWYSRVMIDTYRNELITQLIEKFKLNTKQKCANSYYWGTIIELSQVIDDFILSIVFDENEFFKVGIKNDGNSNLHERLDDINDDISDKWLCCKEYNYNAIPSLNELHILIKRIDDEIFNESVNTSLISKVKTAIISHN